MTPFQEGMMVGGLFGPLLAVVVLFVATEITKRDRRPSREKQNEHRRLRLVLGGGTVRKPGPYAKLPGRPLA